MCSLLHCFKSQEAGVGVVEKDSVNALVAERLQLATRNLSQGDTARSVISRTAGEMD